MFCGECGKEIPDDSVFCENCGAKSGSSEQTAVPEVNEAAPAIAAEAGGVSAVVEETKKIFPIAKVAIIAAVAVVAIIGIFSVMKNSGRNYIYSSISKSNKAYRKEMNDFIDKNAVLKTIKTNLSQSSSSRISMYGNTYTISDDKKTKALSMTTKGDYIPEIGMYLTDTRLIAGSKDYIYFEADPKNLGGELKELAKNFDYLDELEYLDDLADTLNSYDLSYSNVINGKAFTASPVYVNLVKNYTPVMKQLIEKANYQKEKSSVQIGEKEVKADMVTLTADSKIVGSWLKSDVIPALRSDKELEKYWNATNSVYGNINYWYSSQDYDDLVEDFADSIDDLIDEMEDADVLLTAKASIYQGVIVSLEFSLQSDDFRRDPTFSVSALGDKYRLNDVRFEVKDEYGEGSSVTIAGDHIGADVVTSTITVRSYGSRNKADIEWDTTSSSGNLKIKAGGETIKGTLAADGKEMTAKFGEVSWKLGPLDGTIDIPSKTTLIKNIDEDIIEELTEMIFYGGFGGAMPAPAAPAPAPAPAAETPSW